MAETGSGRKGFLHTLLKILTGLFSIVLIAAVGALLVLAQPQKEDKEKRNRSPF